MMWIYSTPSWLQGLLIVSISSLAAVSGLWLRHKKWPGDVPALSHDLGISLVSVVGTIQSLVLAFSSVLVWQSYQSAEVAVDREAQVMLLLYRDVRAFGGPQADAARSAMRDYMKSVAVDEWQFMAKAQESERTEAVFADIFDRVSRLEPDTPRRQVLLSEIFARLNEVAHLREARLVSAGEGMPTSFWIVTLSGSLLVVLYCYLLPLTRLNRWLIAGLGASFGLVFFFIVGLEHPYSGDLAIGFEPFERVLSKMARMR
jgi:hypothetical protein